MFCVLYDVDNVMRREKADVNQLTDKIEPRFRSLPRRREILVVWRSATHADGHRRRYERLVAESSPR